MSTPAADEETVQLRGELVIDTVRRALAMVVGTTAPTVIVDLAAVTFIDSTGLRMLLDAKATLESEGRALTVVNPTDGVKALLSTTGTAEALGIELDLG